MAILTRPTHGFGSRHLARRRGWHRRLAPPLPSGYCLARKRPRHTRNSQAATAHTHNVGGRVSSSVHLLHGLIRRAPIPALLMMAESFDAYPGTRLAGESNMDTRFPLLPPLPWG